MGILLQNRIPTILLPATAPALESCPDGIELVHRRFHKNGIIREDSRLEVPGGVPFHADTGTGQIGRADVRHLAVKDDHLEMDPRTQRPLQAGEKHLRIAQRCPNGNQEFDHTLYLYLPSRCAVVLKKID